MDTLAKAEKTAWTTPSKLEYLTLLIGLPFYLIADGYGDTRRYFRHDSISEWTPWCPLNVLILGICLIDIALIITEGGALTWTLLHITGFAALSLTAIVTMIIVPIFHIIAIGVVFFLATLLQAKIIAAD